MNNGLLKQAFYEEVSRKESNPSAKIKEVAVFISGLDLQRAPARKTSYPASSVSCCGFIDTETPTPQFLQENYALDQNKGLIAGDILIAMRSHNEDELGKLSYISEDLGGYAGPDMAILRPKRTKILGKFLFLLLNSAHFQELIEQTKQNTTALKTLSLDFLEFDIPLPPIYRQKELMRGLKV